MSVEDELAAIHNAALRVRLSSAASTRELVAAWPDLAEALSETADRLGVVDFSDSLNRVRVASAASVNNGESRAWIGTAAKSDELAGLAAALHAVTGEVSDPEPAFHFLVSIAWVTAGSIADRLRERVLDAWTDFGVAGEQRPELLASVEDLQSMRRRLLAVSAITEPLRFSSHSAVPANDLAIAIGRWDIEAHRVLAGEPSTLSLAAIAFEQRHTATAMANLVVEQAQLGHLSSSEAERLSPRADEIAQRWQDLLKRVKPMAIGQGTIPTTLNSAARELRGAVLGSSEDGINARQVLANFYASNVTIAAAVGDTVRDSRLRGLARELAHQIANDPTLERDETRSLISPLDIHHRRSVSLPDPYRRILARSSANLLESSLVALNASAALDRPPSAEQAPHRAARPERRPPAATVQLRSPAALGR